MIITTSQYCFLTVLQCMGAALISVCSCWARGELIPMVMDNKPNFFHDLFLFW